MSSNSGRAWQAMTDFLRLQKRYMVESFAELDLSVQLAHALASIPREGMTMRALADELACDASNATGLADRLEERGLIERRVCQDDRRVKRVFLTVAGRRMQDKIQMRFLTPPAAIAALSPADQRALREILERALAFADAERVDPGA
ncbi:hypothetical protein WPS_24720 [Vulcanimicrobium alpinum]|uniref:HTH marR-type domain-containing protein n=2 Tax=Vulcanimicrobium alpinum TaxID=3016050 RepID=A0AAN2CAK3_UNVUL|nr:hypothetical protein WPS_24720 [Vulcanimicrobium alpinum]